jgi:hypothetical protein
VFALEAVLFILSAAIAARLDAARDEPAPRARGVPRLETKEQSA